MALELSTLVDLKAWMGISASTYDTPLTAALNAAESMIRKRTCRPLGFSYQTVQEYLNGENSDRLVLKMTPVDSAETFTITVGGETVSSTDYTFDFRTGVIGFTNSYLSGWYSGTSQLNRLMPRISSNPVPNFGGGFRQVLVSYTGGYGGASDFEMPAALTTAANMLAASLFQQRQGLGLKTHALGQHSFTFATASEIWDQVDPLIKEFSSCLHV